MVDYLVVGAGLAGISFCEVLEKNKKSFVVFDDASQQSSGVAGGLYNPVILKRFTPVWKANKQLEIAIPFYKELEKKLHKKLDFPIAVKRRFANIEEQNLWFEAADKPVLQKFMSTSIHKNSNANIAAAYGFGEVLYTGRVDSKLLQENYINYLKKYDKLYPDTFNYNNLTTEDDGVSYKDIKARNIVFAEGFGLKKNPFFNYLPLNGTKGELLTIKAPGLKLDFVLKSSVFIIPLGDDLYRIGATYEWHDKTNKVTEEGKRELLGKLRQFLKCDFEIVSQEAGIRPTVTDRRPLVGKHPEQDHIFILNGMGSRGVMIAPFIAHKLFGHIENKKELDREIDIKRFEKKHFNKNN